MKKNVKKVRTPRIVIRLVTKGSKTSLEIARNTKRNPVTVAKRLGRKDVKFLIKGLAALL